MADGCTRRHLRVGDRENERVIVCDAGGVIVQVAESRQRRAWAARFGLSLEDFEQRVWTCISSDRIVPLAEASARAAETFALDETAAQGLLMDFHANWTVNERLRERLVFSQNNDRLVILSNAGPAARFALCTILGLDRYFHPIFISCEIGYEKPDPRAYSYVEDHLAVAPQSCTLIDDRAENIDAARRRGWGAFHTPETSIPEWWADHDEEHDEPCCIDDEAH